MWNVVCLGFIMGTLGVLNSAGACFVGFFSWCFIECFLVIVLLD